MLTVEVVPGTEAGPIFYEINHERSGRSWKVKHRFSTLDAMKHALWKNRLPLPDVPFPRKQAPLLRLVNKWQPHSTLAMPAHELEERRNGLQVYLTALSGLKKSWQSSVVTEVLCVAEEDATVPASSPAAADQPNNAVASSVAPHCASKAVSWVDQQTPAAALTEVSTGTAALRVPQTAASNSPPVSALSSKSIPAAEQVAVDVLDSSTDASDPASVSDSPAAPCVEPGTNEDDGPKQALEAAGEGSKNSPPQHQPLSMETAPTGPGVVADELSARVPTSMVFNDVGEAAPEVLGVSGSSPVPTPLVDIEADAGQVTFPSPLKEGEADITSPFVPDADFAASSSDPSSQQTEEALPTLPGHNEEEAKKLPDVPPAVLEVEEETLSGSTGGADPPSPDAVTHDGVASDANLPPAETDSGVPAPTSAAAAVDGTQVSGEQKQPLTVETSGGAPGKVAKQEQPSPATSAAATVDEAEVSRELPPSPTSNESEDVPDEVAGQEKPSQATSATISVDEVEVSGELSPPPTIETPVVAPDEVAGQEQPSQATSAAISVDKEEVSGELSSPPTIETPVVAPDEVAGQKQLSQATSAVVAVDEPEVSGESTTPTIETSVGAPDEVAGQEQPNQAEMAISPTDVPAVVGPAAAPAMAKVTLDPPHMNTAPEEEESTGCDDKNGTDDAKKEGEEGVRGREGASAASQLGLSSATEEGADDNTGENQGEPSVEPQQQEDGRCTAENTNLQVKDETGKDVLPSLLLSAPGTAAKAAVVLAAEVAAETETERNIWQAESAPMAAASDGQDGQTEVEASAVAAPIADQGSPLPATESTQGEDERPAHAITTKPSVVAEETAAVPVAAADAAAGSGAAVAMEGEEKQEEGDGELCERGRGGASAGSTLTLSLVSDDAKEEPAPQEASVPSANSAEVAAAAADAAAVAMEEEEKREEAGEHFERGRGGASAVSTLTLSSASEDAKEEAATQEASVPSAGSAAAAAAAVPSVAVAEEEKREEGGGEGFERDRGGASAVSALGLSSASEDVKEVVPQEADMPSADGTASSGHHASETSADGHPTATPTSAAKHRTSLLKRARRSLSSKKASPGSIQKAAPGKVAEGLTSPAGEGKSADIAVLASPPTAGGRLLSLRSVSPTPTSGSASSPIRTPRTISKLASFRNKARNLKGRLSLGGGGGSGPLSARPSGSGPIPGRKSLGGGGGGAGRSGSGPLSLSSARGKGKGFFFSSAKSPPPSDAPGSGGGDEVATTADGAVLSPCSLKSADGGDGLVGEPVKTATAAATTVAASAPDMSLAIGREGSTATTDAAAFAVPPSPGAE